ncbi:MAG: hypothetical protein WA139_01540 [Candidatus Aenigmatarchaeota archaeon]
MNGNIFDEQCRLCKFLGNPKPCGRRNIKKVNGVGVCTGYEAEEV